MKELDKQIFALDEKINNQLVPQLESTAQTLHTLWKQRQGLEEEALGQLKPSTPVIAPKQLPKQEGILPQTKVEPSETVTFPTKSLPSTLTNEFTKATTLEAKLAVFANAKTPAERLNMLLTLDILNNEKDCKMMIDILKTLTKEDLIALTDAAEQKVKELGQQGSGGTKSTEQIENEKRWNAKFQEILNEVMKEKTSVQLPEQVDPKTPVVTVKKEEEQIQLPEQVKEKPLEVTKPIYLTKNFNERKHDIETILGIGEEKGKKLKEGAEILTIGDLLDKCSTLEGLTDVSRKANIPESTLQKFLYEAELTTIDAVHKGNTKISGIGENYAFLLVKAGIEGINGLAALDSSNEEALTQLYEKIKTVNDNGSGGKYVPNLFTEKTMLSHLKQWIETAKTEVIAK